MPKTWNEKVAAVLRDKAFARVRRDVISGGTGGPCDGCSALAADGRLCSSCIDRVAKIVETAPLRIAGMEVILAATDARWILGGMTLAFPEIKKLVDALDVFTSVPVPAASTPAPSDLSMDWASEKEKPDTRDPR